MQLMARFCLAYKMMSRDDFGQAGSYGTAEFTQQLDYLIKSRNVTDYSRHRTLFTKFDQPASIAPKSGKCNSGIMIIVFS